MSEPPQQPPYQPPSGDGDDRPAPRPQPSPERPGDQGQSGQGGYAPGPYGQGQPQGPYGPGGYPQGGYQQGGYQPGGQPQDPYGQGGYPQGGYRPSDEPQYPAGGYGAPSPAPSAQGLTIDLGPRLRRRPQPRFGISLAAAGVVIVLVGIAIWSAGYLIEGIHFSTSGGFEGGGRRFLGFGLSLILVLAGYAVAITRKNGPLATAGALGAAVGVPLALVFVTFDLSGISGGLPANTDLVYIVSVIVYLASYFFVPGLRGRSFLLALAALLFAGYLELKVASDSIGRASVGLVGGLGGLGGGTLDAGDFGTGSLTAVALIFGVLYLAAAVFLDLRAMHGAATAMVVAGTYTIVSGIGYGVLTFKQIGTGIELVVLGLVLSYYGARSGRRFTTWFWMFALVVGFGLLVQKATPDSPAGAGITLIVIGLVVVGLAQVATAVLREQPDIVEEPATESGHALPVGGGRRH